MPPPGRRLTYRELQGVYRTPPRHYLLATLLAGILPWAQSAHAAGWFFFDPLTLEAEIRFDGRSDRQDTSPDNEFNTSTLLLEERVHLEQSGFLVDHRVVNFSIELSPVFRQGQEKRNAEKDSFRGRDLDYDINVNVLNGAIAPVSGYFGTSRFTNTNDLAFGTRSFVDNGNSRIGLLWKNYWLPLSFEYRTESINREQIRFDGTRFLRDEDREIYKINGRNRRLSFNLDRMAVDDTANEQQYDISNLNLNHNIRWGRSSYLQSMILINDRRGSLDSRIAQWNERLVLQHTDNLESRTSYRFYSQEANDDSDSHSGDFELSHSLYQNLNTSARVGAQSVKSSLQEQTRYNFGASANYNKSFFFGDINIGLSANYENVDRESKRGLGEIIDERHVAKLVDPITLRRQLVVQSTILVTAVDGFQYEAGIDYEVLTLGGVYTQIRIIPTGRISAGDLLLISYQYILQPSAEYDALFTAYDISFNYRWLRFYHQTSSNQFSLISGFGLPADQSQRSTGLEAAWDFGSGRLRLLVESSQRKNGGLTSNNLNLSQSLGITLRKNLGLNVSSSQIFNESDGFVFDNPLLDPDQRISTSKSDWFTLDAGLSWTPRPNVGVLPSLGVWKRVEDRNQNGVETNIDNLYYSARLRITWWFRKLAVDFYLDHNVIDETDIQKDRNRLFVSVKRRFR